ncbi:Ig-like domain repeat protein [Streptomyces graminilatus]|uniref:Ig-like domain repeat protein n=1 Tax=Streptomyces graminilatus TaxID=1464070 RepID=UPI0006E2C578|nr:Ig-like domain repeat protein [Streptomyces graminilatus]
MRLSRTSVVATAVVVATLASPLALTSGTAFADPGAGVTTHQLVGVGSDVTQDVLDALAGDTVNGTSYAATAVTADGYTIASYDATEPGTGATTSQIQPHVSGPKFLRPNGANAGRLALSDSIAGGNYAVSSSANDGTVNIQDQIDFARNTSAPTVSGTALTAIPFARDAVGYGAKGSALAQLTKQQLHDIYTGALTEVNGVKVHPFIPNSGAGTRTFFQKAIGVTDAQLGSNVDTLDHDGKPVQQNRLNKVIENDGDLVPLSVASLVAQTNGVAPDRSAAAVSAGAFLGSLDEQNNGTYTAPVIHNADGTISSNPDFFADTTFGRDASNVVSTRAIDPTSVFFNKPLYDVFVTDDSHTAALASGPAQSVIAKFGFLNVGYNGIADPTNKHVKRGGLEDGNLSAAVPAAPSVTATPGAGALKLSWAPASGAAVSDYRVTVQDGTGAPVGGYAYKDVPAATTGANLTGLAAGSYTVTVIAADINGNSDATTTNVAVAAARTATTVTASAAVAKPAYGTTESIAVTVGHTGALAPTGTVAAYYGSTKVGSAALNADGKATVKVGTTKLGAVGAKTLSIRYGGDSANTASSKNVTFTVVKATPALTVTAPARISHTKRAAITVKASATGVTPTGKVRIYKGSTLVGSGTLNGGKVTVTIARLAKGKQTLSVRYLGNGFVIAKSKSISITSF